MNNDPPPKPPQPSPPDDADDEQVANSIVRYLNDMLPADEAARMAQRLDGDERLQDLFVQLARLHGLMYEWGRDTAATRGNHTWDLLDDEDFGLATNGAATPSLHDALVQPAIHESDAPEDATEDRGTIVRTAKPVDVPSKWQLYRRPLLWSGLAAAVALTAGGAAWMLQRGQPVVAVNPAKTVVPAPPVAVRPPAVITAVAGAALSDSPSPAPNTPLTVGQQLSVTAGAIEITFDSGAVVTVASPAQLRVVDRNRMAMEDGSLAAHVPPSGIGFRVDSADLTVIDQGTDFGLRPGGNGAGGKGAGGTGGGTELDVFKGAVDAITTAAVDAATQPTAATALRVTGGQAVVGNRSDGGAPRLTTYAPAGFIRSVEDYRVTVALHGTGADVPFLKADPNWTLVAEPSGSIVPPRPVYTLEMRADHFFGATDASKWITTEPRVADAPAGRFTFRTTVRLPEFKPGTASVTGTWGADDQLADVVVNGTSIGQANGGLVGHVSRMEPLTWSLQGAVWHPGDNQVDVVIWNNTVPKGVMNQVAMNLAWTAKFAPPVQRSRPDPDRPAAPATPPGS